MKIVMVFDGLATGGITKVGSDYANLFIRNGHKVTIINLVPKKNDMSNAFDKRCKKIVIPYSRNLVYQKYTLLSLYGIFGILTQFIISFLMAIVSSLYKIVCRIKLKALNDTDILIAFAGHYNDLYFVANNFVRSKAKVAWIHGTEFEYKIISDGFFDLFRRIKNLISLSSYCDITCKKFNDKYQINKKKIYNPIDLNGKEISADKIEKLRTKYGKFVLMVGRLGKDKDQKTVIDAMKILKSKYNSDLKLMLVGDGPKRHELEEYVRQSEMESQVVFMGTCSDVQNYYSAAYVFVHSSPLEGLPTVLLEAMLYGVPIAATDSFPGVREILGDEKYGLISPVYNAKLLADNIYKLETDFDLRNRLISAGKIRLQDFSSEEAIKSVMNMFENILAK